MAHVPLKSVLIVRICTPMVPMDAHKSAPQTGLRSVEQFMPGSSRHRSRHVRHLHHLAASVRRAMWPRIIAYACVSRLTAVECGELSYRTPGSG